MSLLEKINKEKFMSVYDETEPNGKFHVCRYLSEDDTFVLFQAISTRGYNDGFYLIPIDNIYRIDLDDEYTKRMEKLFKLQNQQVLEGLSVTKNSLLIELLCHANQNKLVCSVFLEDEESVTGWISEIDQKKNYLNIEQLAENGTKNGTVFINIDTIEKLICDSGTERCIEMLYQSKNKMEPQNTGDNSLP